MLFDSSAPEVGRALAQVLPRMDRDPAATIEANYSSRSEISEEVDDAFGANQFTISYVPLFLVVLTVSALVVGQNRRPQRADADRLVALGIRRSHVRLSQALALTLVSSGVSRSVWPSAGSSPPACVRPCSLRSQINRCHLYRFPTRSSESSLSRRWC
ncbi:MAG: hypothetical protein WKF83_17335 [Nocardioidaceae bacterium]